MIISTEILYIVALPSSAVVTSILTCTLNRICSAARHNPGSTVQKLTVQWLLPSLPVHTFESVENSLTNRLEAIKALLGMFFVLEILVVFSSLSAARFTFLPGPFTANVLLLTAVYWRFLSFLWEDMRSKQCQWETVNL